MEKLKVFFQYKPGKTMAVVFACVLVNYLGKAFAASLELPLWLDCLGTVFAAYALGPVSGALVGCTGNIIYSFWNANSLIYGITSVFVGLSAGAAARKKYFESVFGATSIAGGVAIGSALISTVLNLLFYGGNTGNVWGDGVKNYMIERGVSPLLSAAAGELYLDFLDKLITFLLLYAIIKLGGRLRARGWKKRGAAAGALALLLCAGMRFSPDARAMGAEDTVYIRQVYNAENGLPCGQANDIAQTNEGILWIGTNSGLFRYNGSSFRFMEDYDAVKNVNCLYADQEGRLWIGTNDNGLVLSINEKAVNTLDSESGLPADSVLSIAQSARGDYYVGTSGALAVVRISTGIKISRTLEQVRGAHCVSADKNGNVAAVTADGGLYLLGNRELLHKITPPDRRTAFSACAFRDDGTLFAGTSDGNIYTYRIEGDRAEESGRIRCEGAAAINQIFFHEGSAWVLANNGIGTLSGETYRRIDTEDFRASIRRMTVDYQGHLWFASSKLGLLQLSETAFPNLYAEYGLRTEPVNTTAFRDGILYIGTERGLTILDLRRGGLVIEPLRQLLTGSAVTCMRTDDADNLWICSEGKGLVRVSPDGEFTVFDAESGLDGSASVCAPLPGGGVAVGGDGGLTLLEGEETRRIPYGGELGEARILSICPLADGRILLGTEGNGIVAVRDGAVTGHITKENGLPSGFVQRIVPDGESGRLFLVTGSSLCYMEGDRVTPVSRFPYSDNYDIVLDDDGEAFVLSSAGIYVVRKEELLSGESFDCALLDARAGFMGSLTKNAWNALTAEGDLYLSTDRGAVRMNLDAYRPEKSSYRLMVSEIRLDGKAFPIERGEGFTVGREVSSIAFIPEIVNYSLEDPKVSYCLDGVDSGYKTVPQSEIGSVVYTNLPSGEYAFRLAIIDEDTGRVWEESSYGFTKEKSIHDNGWFLVYMLIVGGLFVGWLTWFLTRLGAQRTIALQQERLALALKQVQLGNETILAIAKTVDAKDVLTSKHSQRVSDYSVLIARRLGFSEAEQENIRKAALLHDLGKVGVPDSILNKPAPLTDKEYAVMKTHVTIGADILKDFTLVEHVVEGARYHHERFDGKGYPDGLKGTDIPLYGRIIAIADAFDAMTANRVYRKRQIFPYVLDQLHKGQGTQFDPELLDIFLDVLDSGEIDVKSLYAEPTEEIGEEKADE